MIESDHNIDQNGFSDDNQGNTPMGIPDGYFNGLSRRIQEKIQASEELHDFPALRELSKVNPFSVPEQYFERNEELLIFPELLMTLSPRPGYQVPADYFLTFPQVLTNRIGYLEEIAQYPALISLKVQENAFLTPNGYFDISLKTPKEKTAKIFTLSQKPKQSRLQNWAIAASVLLITSLSVLLYQQLSLPQSHPENCNGIACLSKKEILNSSIIQNMSEEYISDLIETNDLGSDSLILHHSGPVEKINANDLSEQIDLNMLTEEL